METSLFKLNKLLTKAEKYLLDSKETDLLIRPNPTKWSKKEILGHLIDSAINNLQRFTEIPFFPQPYIYRPYLQAELVRSNDYQNAELSELISCWLALNKRITKVIELRQKKDLDLKILLTEGETIDLRFLIIDYVEHLEWHVNQILG